MANSESKPPPKTSPFTRLRETVVKNPGLSLAAVAMISLVVMLKGMTVRATMQDADVGKWIAANGGAFRYDGDSWTYALLYLETMFGSRALKGWPITTAVIPVSVLNNQHDETFSNLSRLSQLKLVQITAFPFGPPPNLRGGATPGTAVCEDQTTIDSSRLQQGLASLNHPVELLISQANLSPCEHPVDLGQKLTGISLQNVHVTRDFAKGLPIVQDRTHIQIQNAILDDDAVDILLERSSANRLWIINTSMTARTNNRLLKMRVVRLMIPKIIDSMNESAKPNSMQSQ